MPAIAWRTQQCVRRGRFSIRASADSIRLTGEGRANAPAAFRANSRIGHTNTIYTYTVGLSSVSALLSTVAITGDPIDSGELVVSVAAIPGAVAVAVPEPYTIALAGGLNGTELN